MPGKTPQEIMTCIADMKTALRNERANTAPGSPERDKIDSCRDHLDEVLYEIIAQDLHSRTGQLQKLKDGLVGATQKLDDLKQSIQNVVAALGTVAAIVNAATALLPLL